MATPQSRQVVDACTLSFIAGFVDTCVFVGLYGLFTAHVTGNLALLGAALVHRSGGELAKLLALPVFALAVVGTVYAAWFLKRAGLQRVPPLLYAESLLLLVTAAFATSAGPASGPDSALAILAGMSGVTAMGLQNALMRIELSTLPATTVMTVNVTQVIVDAVMLTISRAHPQHDADPVGHAKARFDKLWPPVAAFAGGAASGAVGYTIVEWACLLVPAGACLGLGIALARR